MGKVYELEFLTHFDAAHHLPKHQGRCHTLHGHRWEVVTTLIATELNSDGMIVDFSPLKKVVNSVLPDHDCINTNEDFLRFGGDPTAENLSEFLYLRITQALQVEFENPPKVKSVTVFESPGCGVTYYETESE